ncbi:MAG: ABC transporter permease subunit [Clostridia bacterium]|nr:ABC transporter permease subunit [Clostridia bacterium]
MFSKSLFKQSCKANGTMWIIITVAVCFMLSCVMLISGNGAISKTKEAIQSTIIEGELRSSLQKKALNYYEIGNDAMARFDETFISEYQSAYMNALAAGMPAEQAAPAASMGAYAAAASYLQNTYVPGLIQSYGYDAESQEAQELQGVVFYVLNPLQEDGTYMFDGFFAAHGENLEHYTDLLANIGDAIHPEEREKYVMNHCAPFMAGNMVAEENVQSVLDVLADYGISKEQYDEFGFSDYSNVKDIAMAAIVDYRANLEYRLDNMKDGQTVESIKEELQKQTTNSLLASLPEEVSASLDELGQMDLFGVLVGSIFFKMAGLLLPIIYMIMVSNALIAGQVDSGSMAYILSTSTKRRSVTFTQAAFLISSLFAMFVLTAITSVICLSIVDVNTGLTWQKLLLLNLGAFLVMFAMSGICFLASCWFDRSKHAMGIGGGLSMFFLVATMLGLFGSTIMPSIIRMEALNYFNYATIITLFDPISILEGTWDFLWKFGILIAVGCACYFAGGVRFRKKDLPL